MMKNRQYLSALIHLISNHLNQYLQTNNYSKKGNAIQASPTIGNEFRNRALLSERIRNILNCREQLEAMLSSFIEKKEDLSDEQLKNNLSQIRVTLIQTSEINRKLSIKFGYIHKTYEENRTTLQGSFASWWNKTFFQSRAAVALEKCLNDLGHFELRLVQKLKIGAA